MTTSRSNYHHGDLRSSLLAAATDLIREGGVDALSMRKLADRVGVSRTAPYHHFTDKQALLSALAEEGFRRFEAALAESLTQTVSPEAALSGFIRCYLRFAQAHPETYSLMFGHAVWRSGAPSGTLRDEAYASFQRHVTRITDWQQQGVLPKGVEPLRFAQVTWSTLHGLARLLIDGIYLDDRHLDELLDLAEGMFRQALT